MKRIISILLLCSVALASCENLTSMNVDPNHVTTTHPQLLLPDIAWNAFSEASTGPVHACRMQVKNDQISSEQTYTWTRGSFGDYANLRNVQKMEEEAEGIGSNVYVALAKFFKACFFYNLTMTFGDIPYSQALKGEAEQIYTPVYDTQEQVFAGILQHLATADSLLALDGSVIDGDIIYGGDASKWRKLVNSFRLKVLMSLSRRGTVGGMDVAQEFAATVAEKPLMESIADDAKVVYEDKTGMRYPQYNSTMQSTEAYSDSTFVQRLADRRDPRLFTFCQQTKNAQEAGMAVDDFDSYEGGDPIVTADRINAKVGEGAISKLNERFYFDAVNEPSIWLGYAELQQILAEATVRGWISGDAQAHYENGVRASFEFYRTYCPDYAQYLGEDAVEAYLEGELVDFSRAATDEERIALIIMQKYIASFYQGGWTPYDEQLRTGSPGVRVAPGTEYPHRWMYPQSEYTNNAANVEEAITRQFGMGNDNISESTWQNK